MRFATLALGLAVVLGYALPAQAVFLFQDEFNSGTSMEGRTPDVGVAYGGPGLALQTIAGGRVTMDAASAGASLGWTSVTGFTIPTLSSGNKLVASIEISSISDSETVDVGEFFMRIQGGSGSGNEFYFARTGVASGGANAGEYSVGTWNENGPADVGGSQGQYVNTGVAVPGLSLPGGPSHVLELTYLAKAAGVERQTRLSIDGGAQTLVGPALLEDFDEFGGTSAENPGSISSIRATARGGDQRSSNAAFSMDFARVELLAVPEPASAALLGLGSLLIFRQRRR